MFYLLQDDYLCVCVLICIYTYIYICIHIHSVWSRLIVRIIYCPDVIYNILPIYLDLEEFDPHNEKLRYGIWTNFGPNSWNWPTKYRPHHITTRLDADSVRKKKFGDPQVKRNQIMASVAWSPNKNMAQPEFTKKCCDSWWLLGMIPWHQPVPNSSSFH